MSAKRHLLGGRKSSKDNFVGNYTRQIPCLGRSMYRVHYIGGVESQLKPWNWDNEARNFTPCEWTEYIMSGVWHGFPIVDDNCVIEEYYCKNYSSAEKGPAAEYLTKLFQSEIEDNKIVEATETPTCIHAIGAVNKKDGLY